MKFFKNSKNGLTRRSTIGGFTLIELLVVVAIIGLLSSIILSNLNSARAKGRNAKRASDVHQLKIAMEYFYDVNGSYPSVGSNDTGYAISALATPLFPYLKQIPDDPLGASYAWQYTRGPVADNSYGLWIYNENLSVRCGSGVNFNPGWWGIGTNMCPF
ncbi:MAG: prepilin-type N-terminal cleavage/methylation domain-containing protein [bacterium]